MKILSLSLVNLDNKETNLYFPIFSHRGYFTFYSDRKNISHDIQEVVTTAENTHALEGPGNIAMMPIKDKFYYLKKENNKIYTFTLDEEINVRSSSILFHYLKKDLANPHIKPAELVATLEALLAFDKKLKNVHKDIEETKKIMLQNIDILLSRQEKMDDILQKTEALRATTLQFKTNAMRLKKGNWFSRAFKNCRFFSCLHRKNNAMENSQPQRHNFKISK